MSTPPDAPPPSPRPPSSPPPDPWARRRARRRWIVAAAVLLVGITTAVVAVAEHRAWVEQEAEYDAEVARVTDEAQTSRARAEDAYAAGRDALSTAIDAGRPVYTASQGQVADPAVREPLAAALRRAEGLRDTEVSYPVTTRTVEAVTRPHPFRRETLPRVVAEVVDGADPSPAELDEAAAEVAEARVTVASARRQWAYDGLRGAAAEGRDAVEDLRPQVGARPLAVLDDAVTEAQAVLDAGPDVVDPDTAVTLRKTLLGTTTSLWTDRLAALRDARRAAAGVDCREARCVALTFDDGPVADTRRLLRILDRKEAPATFFMLGDNVARRPDVARAVARGGHLVANHSWNHPQLTTLDDDAVRDQLRRTRDTITDATGATPFLLRPPYGDVDARVRGLATRTGLDVVLWSLDTEDWRTRDAQETRDRVRARVEPGANVLLHDIHPSTVDAVPQLIDDLRRQDYVLVTADLLVE